MARSGSPSKRSERRLAAIMFTDIVGYTALMAESEETGFRVRQHHRALFEPLAARYGGEIVDENGDELVLAFPSALDAVNCALLAQAELEGDGELKLRIGIHLGDVVFEAGRVYGDGVNVASRIRPFAEPGGIAISDEVEHSIHNQPQIEAVPLGMHELKNVARPMAIFAVRGESSPPGAHPVQRPFRSGAPALAALAAVLVALGIAWVGGWIRVPEQGVISGFSAPALAVLPFDNLSGDPTQDLFVAGLTEDLTTRLASWRRLPVIARNSAFKVSGQERETDAAKAGADLGARYVVVGSVRSAGERVRVSVQLVDATTGQQVWAERYDREFAEILAMQDEITTSIVAAMQPSLLEFESDRAMHQDPDNLDAWSSAQRGWWHFNQENREDNALARDFFERAIEQDPRWGWPHAGLALTHFKDASRGWTDSPNRSIHQLVRAAERAVALDDRDASAHHALGHAYSMSGRSDKMIAAFELGAELNPSDAMANKCLGAHLAIVGRSEAALRHLERAMAISPRDPWMFAILRDVSWAHFAARDYEAALAWAERSIRQRPNPPAYQIAVASLAYLNRRDEAQRTLEELLRLQPDLSREGLQQFFASADPDFPRRLIRGLKEAGWEPPHPKRGPFYKM